MLFSAQTLAEFQSFNRPLPNDSGLAAGADVTGDGGVGAGAVGAGALGAGVVGAGADAAGAGVAGVGAAGAGLAAAGVTVMLTLRNSSDRRAGTDAAAILTRIFDPSRLVVRSAPSHDQEVPRDLPRVVLDWTTLPLFTSYRVTVTARDDTLVRSRTAAWTLDPAVVDDGLRLEPAATSCVRVDDVPCTRPAGGLPACVQRLILSCEPALHPLALLVKFGLVIHVAASEGLGTTVASPPTTAPASATEAARRIWRAREEIMR